MIVCAVVWSAAPEGDLVGELVVLAPDAESKVSGKVRLAVRADALHFFDAKEQAMRAP